ncbi:N-acetylmuramoyl-L-alanine amidase [Empedobacter stercoris]|uniref:N-acetylmuramoyl-L-alanine amidase n=1 Tax=Empedobacter stercoris TaxID=1628248 RepID=UPI001CE06103|nr:N-acetylmuramoyl-L-alanine amidase [Empedobacter stercoris]
MILTSALFAQNSKTFVIDAGHGGHDVGSKNSVITESEYSLELAQKIQESAKKKISR